MSSVVTDNKNIPPSEQFICSDDSDDMADLMIEVRRYLTGTKIEGSMTVPRFGLLSIKAETTPIYVYDHPALMKITNTAFTDGVHIFVAAPFMRKLEQESVESKGAEYGIEPLIMHELMHMLLGHIGRLKNFPHDVANRAEDLVINSKLQLAFPAMKWTKTISEVGLGFKSSEAEKYAVLAEETVARMLMEERERQKEKEEKNKQQGGGGQGQQQPGQNGQQQGQGGGGQGQSKPQNGKGQKGSGQGGGKKEQGSQGDGSGGQGEPDPNGENGWSDIHHVPLEDLIQTLEENGLTGIMNALELPSSDSVEEIAKIQEGVLSKDVEAVSKAELGRMQAGDKYPGGHIIDAAAERIKGLSVGKLEWKLGVRDEVFGGGMRFNFSEEAPDPMFYIPGEEMGLSDPVWLGCQLPHSPEDVVIVVCDTSGSVSPELLREFASEILTLKKGASSISDTASEIILLSADTALRGEATVITEDNMEEMLTQGVNFYGRGGTDIAKCLHDTMGLDIVKNKKIRSFIYMTDGYDERPPKSVFQPYLDKGIRFAFVIDSKSTLIQEWVRDTSEYARVYPIAPGYTVDLTENQMSTDKNPMKNRIK